MHAQEARMANRCGVAYSSCIRTSILSVSVSVFQADKTVMGGKRYKKGNLWDEITEHPSPSHDYEWTQTCSMTSHAIYALIARTATRLPSWTIEGAPITIRGKETGGTRTCAQAFIFTMTPVVVVHSWVKRETTSMLPDNWMTE